MAVFEQKVILKAIDEVSKTQKEILRNTKRTNSEMRGEFQKTEKSVRGVGSSLMNLKTVGIAVGAFFTGKFVQSLIDTETNLNKVERALKVATGTSVGAAQEMEFLRKESNRLGLEFKSVAITCSQLAAATKNTSLTTAQTRDIFLATAEAGSALGLSADDMAGALNAMQQMVSKGTVQAEELRGQLGERIPGAFTLAAKSMGVTTQQLGKLLEQGKVTAADMLPKLATEMRKTFGGEAEAGARALSGQINQFKNSLFELRVAILESGIGDLLIESFRQASSIIKSVTKDFSDFLSALGGGKDVTSDNQKALGKLLSTLSVVNDNYYRLGQTTQDNRNKMESLRQEIDAIQGAGYAENFLKKSREEQIQFTRAVFATVEGLDKQEKKIAQIQEAQKAKFADKPVSEAPKMEDFREQSGLELMREDMEAQISLQYEIREMMINSQVQSRAKEFELEKLDFEKKTDWRINALAKDHNYVEAAEKLHASKVEAIKKKHLAQDMYYSKLKTDLAFSTANNILSALSTLTSGSKRFAKLNKILAIGSIGLNTAQSVMKALASPPGPPLTLPLALSVGAMGAAQMAKAASAKVAAKGADYTTSGPELLLVGDNPGGREKVQVTPLSSPNINGPKGGQYSFGGVSINVGPGDIAKQIRDNPESFAEALAEAVEKGYIQK